MTSYYGWLEPIFEGRDPEGDLNSIYVGALQQHIIYCKIFQQELPLIWGLIMRMRNLHRHKNAYYAYVVHRSATVMYDCSYSDNGMFVHCISIRYHAKLNLVTVVGA